MDTKCIAFSSNQFPPAAQPSQPQRTPSVPVQIGNLRETVDRLHTYLSTLSARLGPVSRHDQSPGTPQGPSPERQFECETAQAIGIEALRILECCEIIDVMIGHLEI